MYNEINLLRTHRKDLEQRKKVVYLSRVIAFSMLGIVVLIMIVVIVLKFISPLPSLQSQEQDLQGRLARLDSKRGKFLIVSDRIRNISTILSGRIDYFQKIDTIVNQLSTDIIILSFSIDKANLQMTVGTPSLTSLNTFIERLLELTGEKKVFTKLTLNSLSLDTKNNKYILSIEGSLL